MDGGLDAVDGELVGGGVAHNATFADVLAAGFKLGLDEDDGFAVPLLAGGCEGGDDGWEDEGGGDEADVHGEEADRLGGEWEELAGDKQARVGALEEADAGVGAELVVDLAVAGVYSQNRLCAGLKHAVCEAAGGGSDVGAGEACDGDGPGGEGRLQLESAAADVAEVVAEHTDDGVLGDGGARFVDPLLVDEDATGEDQSLGALAGGGEGAVNEELVETEFHRCGPQ